MTKKIIIIIAVLLVALIIFFLTSKPATSNKDQNINLENGVQVIHMSESAQGYSPNSITIKKGIPVRWEIEGSTDRTCANALIVPEYKIRAFLKPGKNIIEFTPDKTGQIPFSCSMRMYTGTFNVID